MPFLGIHCHITFIRWKMVDLSPKEKREATHTPIHTQIRLYGNSACSYNNSILTFPSDVWMKRKYIYSLSDIPGMLLQINVNSNVFRLLWAFQAKRMVSFEKAKIKIVKHVKFVISILTDVTNVELRSILITDVNWKTKKREEKRYWVRFLTVIKMC